MRHQYLLQEIGFKTYVPIHNELRNWKDRKKWIEVPLFRSYVFIYTDYKSRHYAFKVQGIVKYVTIGNDNAKLRDGEIEKIEQICNSNEKITIEYDKLEIGQKVLIIDGPLLGLEGYVFENGGNKRVGINIQGLNCFASVQIDSTKVKLQLT